MWPFKVTQLFTPWDVSRLHSPYCFHQTGYCCFSLNDCVCATCGYSFACTYAIALRHNANCLVHNRKAAEGQPLLSSQNPSYICLICLCLPVFFSHWGISVLNPSIQLGVHGPGTGGDRQPTLCRKAHCSHSGSNMPSSYSPSCCVCFSLLKQVFLTRWSLDSLQCANASAD